MTKKHFKLAAAIVAAQRQLSVRERTIVALAFAMLFEHNNPRFAKDRFMVECGLAAPPPRPVVARKRRRCVGDPFTID